MEIPDHLKRLVDELGDALVRALLEDAPSRALVQRLQLEGYDLSLSLEATPEQPPHEEDGTEAPQVDWSEDDRAFLRTFRIKLDE